MASIEYFLECYLASFFIDNDEKELFKTKSNFSDFVNTTNNDEWLKAENELKSFLPYGNLNDYTIRINKSASDFIEYLANVYIDDNTWILGTDEHYNIRNIINSHKNSMFLTREIIETFNIDLILQKYKQTNCNKIFIYLTSLVDTIIIPQTFYIKLKNALIEQNIQCVFIMDDIQSMFIIPRDYSIFDYVLFTGHSLVPSFNLGILFSKKLINFGFTDTEKLKKYINVLKIILNKKDMFYLFNIILNQYFAEELTKKDLFRIPTISIPNGFYIWLTNEKIKNFVQKYKEELLGYGIEVNHYISIKSNFIIGQDITHIIEGLKKVKDILNKAIKLKNKMDL